MANAFRTPNMRKGKLVAKRMPAVRARGEGWSLVTTPLRRLTVALIARGARKHRPLGYLAYF